MKRTIAVLTAAALTAAPTAAFASSATLRLVLRIPVHCTLDVVGGTVLEDRLVLQVYRNCNTGHQVVLSGLDSNEFGDVSVSYNGELETVAGDQVLMDQSERYYDQTDDVVIKAANASSADMYRLAGSLQLSVVVA
ncbi:MAG: hypothetical protein JNM03_02555 [Sphingopyxis sp.]|jgi:hypothetical protein|uniref:hypothetical protein n=1 Tax=Sphingopyxis sp. TaxID=1908224 RepID=UPI001A382E98|nr:hypothetical protein [Sphingopyxis sp.]MBL9068855.1 hypothetical protein [Sphingopyxis sp.]